MRHYVSHSTFVPGSRQQNEEGEGKGRSFEKKNENFGILKMFGSVFYSSKLLVGYTLYLRPSTLYLIPHTLYFIPYTLYRMPYTLHLIPYTVYLIPYTVHLLPYAYAYDNFVCIGRGTWSTKSAQSRNKCRHSGRSTLRFSSHLRTRKQA